ncbi:MAG: response regulator [Elusimicrobia bacterium]|nr:response regulator [Elusimicrobiota bacterium]
MDEASGAPLAKPNEKLVLLVDDDTSILDLMEHVIRKEGFRVDRATDGAEALRKTKAVKPDIVVLDFMLPEVGGFEVLKELQGRQTCSVPVLVITGRHMDGDAIDMIRREPNVFDFLEKPIRPAVLMTALHRALKTAPPEARPQDQRGDR